MRQITPQQRAVVEILASAMNVDADELIGDGMLEPREARILDALDIALRYGAPVGVGEALLRMLRGPELVRSLDSESVV